MLDDDSILVRKAQAGDRSAWDELHRKYRKLVFHMVARQGIRGPEEVYDVAQDVWLRAFSSVSHVKSGAAFKGWLSRITQHVVIDRFRKCERSIVVEAMDRDSDGEADESPDAATPAPDAERIFGSKEVLKKALKRLLPEQRAILHLKYVEECTLKQIAVRMNASSEQTIEGRLIRAKRRLRRAVGELSHGRDSGETP